MNSLIKITVPIIFLCIIILYAQDKDRIKRIGVFVIESIAVEGNSKTSESVILENLSFSVGDKVSEDEINKSIDELKSLNFFRAVNLSPRAGSEPGYLNLIITVKERYWPTVRFKGGFSELDSWYITPISIHFDNIFGFGNYINLDFTIGD